MNASEVDVFKSLQFRMGSIIEDRVLGHACKPLPPCVHGVTEDLRQAVIWNFTDGEFDNGQLELANNSLLSGITGADVVKMSREVGNSKDVVSLDRIFEYIQKEFPPTERVYHWESVYEMNRDAHLAVVDSVHFALSISLPAYLIGGDGGSDYYREYYGNMLNVYECGYWPCRPTSKNATTFLAFRLPRMS
jgi:hypothetical protein